MTLQIKLMGMPEIRTAGGQRQLIRGHQAWALLARLLLSSRPLSRRSLANDLFPETVDPLGSLRWTLASLRKSLDCPGAFLGDPISTVLPDGTVVNVIKLSNADFDIESAGPLLEGVEPQCGPEFSTWLLVERERIASLVDAQVRQEAQHAIAVGDAPRAARLAELIVRRMPFDEGAHILLLKTLIAGGRFDAADLHVEAIDKLFREQLGRAPSPALRSAARRTLSSPPSGVSPVAVAESLLEAGIAALSAGAIDAGVDCLRRAAADAQSCGDARLQGQTLIELGSALVHAVRGHDDEGAILLRQSIEFANRCGDASMACTAHRELGYVDTLAGRRPSAADHLAEALRLAGGDDALAGTHGVIGMNLVDWGRVDEGLAHYELSLEHARRSGNRRRQVWSMGLGAWGLLAADRAEDANRWLQDCLTLIDELRWTSFRPWPCALLGESRLRLRIDPMTVMQELGRAFALSCQLADPCWEAAVARVMARCHEVAGNPERATEWLSEARKRCVRQTDTYVALLVEILADQARISARLGHAAQSNICAREMLSLAARAHMDAHVHRAIDLIASSVTPPSSHK